MTEAEIRPWVQETHPAYKPFCKVMEKREYGPRALQQAWCFFRDGWDCCKDAQDYIHSR